MTFMNPTLTAPGPTVARISLGVRRVRGLRVRHRRPAGCGAITSADRGRCFAVTSADRGLHLANQSVDCG